jgi:hypothetical protein
MVFLLGKELNEQIKKMFQKFHCQMVMPSHFNI